MPYDVLKRGDKYVVVKEATGEVVGTHESRAKAVSQMRAIHANEHAPTASPGMMHGGTMMLDDSYQPRPITEAYVNGKKHPVMHTPPPPPVTKTDDEDATLAALDGGATDFKALAKDIKDRVKK